MSAHGPVIKGIFVMSHVRALRRTHGADAVAELERRFGHPIDFGLNEDVPVRHEIAILEHIVDLSHPEPLPAEERQYEAGRLHFRNFSHTPLGVLVLPFFGNDFKKLALGIGSIAESVFEGISFQGSDAGPQAVKIVMDNTDYPLQHFRGFFAAWIEHGNLRGDVAARQEGDRMHVYDISWS